MSTNPGMNEPTIESLSDEALAAVIRGHYKEQQAALLELNRREWMAKFWEDGTVSFEKQLTL